MGGARLPRGTLSARFPLSHLSVSAASFIQSLGSLLEPVIVPAPDRSVGQVVDSFVQLQDVWQVVH